MLNTQEAQSALVNNHFEEHIDLSPINKKKLLKYCSIKLKDFKLFLNNENTIPEDKLKTLIDNIPMHLTGTQGDTQYALDPSYPAYELSDIPPVIVGAYFQKIELQNNRYTFEVTCDELTNDERFFFLSNSDMESGFHPLFIIKNDSKLFKKQTSLTEINSYFHPDNYSQPKIRRKEDLDTLSSPKESRFYKIKIDKSDFLKLIQIREILKDPEIYKHGIKQLVDYQENIIKKLVRRQESNH